MRLFLLAALLLASVTASSAEDGQVLYLLRYTPGHNWNADVAYDEQPGIKDHLAYLDQLFKEQRLLMGGPIAGGASALVVLRTGSLDQARRVADNDPGVARGIVEVTVSAWQVKLSSMRQIRPHAPVEVEGPDKPWRLKSIDPSAPINIDNRED